MRSTLRLCVFAFICWLSVWTLPTVRAAQQIVSAQEVLDSIKTTLDSDGSQQDEIYFENVEIQGSLDFTELAGDGLNVVIIDVPVYFLNVTFTGNVTALLDSGEKIVTVHFAGGANFRGSIFQEDVVFSGASLVGSNFDNVQFMKSAQFQYTQFSDGASFRQTIFGQLNGNESDNPCAVSSPDTMVNFANAKFDTPVDFSGAMICQPAFFIDTQFLQDTRFVSVIFGSILPPLEFTGVNFYGSVVFQGSTFFLNTVFTDAEFTQDADFMSVKFKAESRFNGATFSRGAFFKDTDFNSAQFSGVNFAGKADFSATDFTQEGNFKGSNFDGRAIFRDANFGNFSLEEATFEQELDFNGVTISGGLDFRNSEYGSLDTRRFDFDALNRWKEKFSESDNEPISSTEDYLIAVLSGLDKKFRSQDQLELANEAFYRRNVVERGQLNPLDGLISDIVDKVLGYGVMSGRVIVTAIFFIVFFAFFYCSNDTLREIERDPKVKRGLRLIDLPVIFDVKASTVFEPKSSFPQRLRIGLGFSLGIFTKMNLVNKACYHKWIKWVVILEWGLSVVLLAVLVYTLSNTNPLLHELLQALFP